MKVYRSDDVKYLDLWDNKTEIIYSCSGGQNGQSACMQLFCVPRRLVPEGDRPPRGEIPKGRNERSFGDRVNISGTRWIHRNPLSPSGCSVLAAAWGFPRAIAILCLGMLLWVPLCSQIANPLQNCEKYVTPARY